MCHISTQGQTEQVVIAANAENVSMRVMAKEKENTNKRFAQNTMQDLLLNGQILKNLITAKCVDYQKSLTVIILIIVILCVFGGYVESVILLYIVGKEVMRKRADDSSSPPQWPSHGRRSLLLRVQGKKK